MKKDISTKEIIKSITIEIAKYILNIELESVKFIDKELDRIEKREADVVIKCKISGVESILHLEIQNSNDKIMPKRMLRYFVDITTLYPDLPIHQYLIYIGKKKLNMSNEIVAENINYRYNLVDMHDIECQKLLELDTPEALVLSILCDFRGRDELELLVYIIKRLKELVNEDEHRFSKYMLILETLSTNRDLETTVKEAEEMLKNIELEKLPSYEIGFEQGIKDGIEKGIQRGIQRGIEKATLKNAMVMIKRFKLSIDEVSKELDIDKEKLLEFIKKQGD